MDDESKEIQEQAGWGSGKHHADYQDCCQLAVSGRWDKAKEGFLRLLDIVEEPRMLARIHNDLGVLASLEGAAATARRAFDKAVALVPNWQVPRENRRRIDSAIAPAPRAALNSRPQRVAIVSLLFNWPSTGGGTVHTAETGKFLTQAGYVVRHFYAEYPEWGLGNVTDPPLAASEAVRFTSAEWSVPDIQARFRAAIQNFGPDWVIVTDSWNSKPILAEAVNQYRYFLRIAAQECLCPLNNVRLLFEEGNFKSCRKHQFATPADCCLCVQTNGRYSGGLHRGERELVQYGTTGYDRSLRSAFGNAEGILVVNPLIGAMVGPYAKRVHVIPSGFDSTRFPDALVSVERHNHGRFRFLFAGLVNEPMKGFDVLHAACQNLWKKRQDFELIATADPVGQVDPFTRHIGWQSQATLPAVMHDADIVVVPTVAEEALGRTAVEAMGVGRPVIASRIGGLQFTVADGATGLLFRPGDIGDLERQMEALMDDEELRRRLGQAGRRRFEEEFTWESIMERHYLPLLGSPLISVAPKKR
ncbi:MAG: glycosyl transferase group 1 [Schlesneria sp.]|nr:glycosyl transferase group 1 [Schlesneria sp.]